MNLFMCTVYVCDQFLFVTSHSSERAIPFKLNPFIALLPINVTSSCHSLGFSMLTFHFMQYRYFSF